MANTRTRGKPQRISGAAPSDDRTGRPRRVPVSGYRDILVVYNKDPNFHYRWVNDKNHNGTRIYRFLQAGYVLVSTDEVTVGDDRVYKSDTAGSYVATPADREGQWLFLMKIQKELYDEDQDAKQMELTDIEEQVLSPPDPDNPEGRYGPGGFTSYQ